MAITVVPQTFTTSASSSTDNNLNTSAQWGPHRQLLDPTSLNPALGQLHSRTWSVHWSLFGYFNGPQGKTTLMDAFLAPTYLKTIQTSCHWLLRYITATAVLSRKASAEVTEVIQTEEYSDCVTNSLKALYMDFDSEEVQKEFGRAVEVVGNDFFLQGYKDELLDNNIISISRPPLPVYQSVIEKTCQLAVLTQALGVAFVRPGVQPSTQHQQQAAQRNSAKEVATVGA
ncbi:hypothetical protein CVT24_002682 [Panaeolus cyanescens]|uniref:Uncharacterized protein n=1 Tax=Panaeolus cyanescens TaxID=181874 RepID=A0A409WBD2_9AGAR|nr:hypothetical protein CVT24_002682 [Panaeolus cyanescens]